MAVLHPFNAWRPPKKYVPKVASVPYDVIDSREAAALAKNNPHSFLHVIRPEIDLPGDISYQDDRVYQKGGENLKRFLKSEIFIQEEMPAVYLYRLSTDEHTQTGIFSCVAVEDYDNEIILKHELTRPDKEDDRTRHILTQSAHAEPVIMTFKDEAGIAGLSDKIVEDEIPLYDFTADDRVQHTLWRVPEAEAFVEAFSRVESLYIADGHHRCKSASRVAEVKRNLNKDHTGKEEYNFFPAVLFPMNQMNILPYNRIVYTIPGGFHEKLQEKFVLKADADPVPRKKGSISLYLKGNWYTLDLPISEHPNSVERLDVYRLQNYLLTPLLGISDPRNDKNIDFVGGIRGTGFLEKLVDGGKADLAISMYPTSIEELVRVSDEGLLMPPKSTWFEPKLRSGILIHTF